GGRFGMNEQDLQFDRWLGYRRIGENGLVRMKGVTPDEVELDILMGAQKIVFFTVRQKLPGQQRQQVGVFDEFQVDASEARSRRVDLRDFAVEPPEGHV